MLLGNDLPALRDLNNFVVPYVGNKWFNLGLQLIDPANESLLYNMKADRHKNFDEQCTEMFSQWLQTESKANWNYVIFCLKAPAVNLKNLAKDIESKLDNRVSDQLYFE